MIRLRQLVIRRGFASFYDRFKSYRNTNTQEHMHEYEFSAESLAIKKRFIDYELIEATKGTFKFREFEFVEPTKHYTVIPRGRVLEPNNKWTREQMLKDVENVTDLTRSEEDNNFLQEECKNSLQDLLRRYYKSIGKENYKFILKEEISKISLMTSEEFKKFISILETTKTPPEQPKQRDYSQAFPILKLKIPQSPDMYPIREIKIVKTPEKISHSKDHLEQTQQLEEQIFLSREQLHKKQKTLQQSAKDDRILFGAEEQADETREYSNQKGIKPKSKRAPKEPKIQKEEKAEKVEKRSAKASSQEADENVKEAGVGTKTSKKKKK